MCRRRPVTGWFLVATWQRRLYPNVTYGEYVDKPGKSPRSPPLDKAIIALCTGLKAQDYCAELDV